MTKKRKLKTNGRNNMREKEPSTNIIYIRHGKTDFPLDRIYCDDKEDPALNSVGEEQARQTFKSLQSMQIDAVYSSPTQRTLRTAQLIAPNHIDSIMTLPQLKERHFGIWEGLYFHEIEQNFPNEYQQWKKNPTQFSPEQAESVLELRQRLKNTVTDIIANNEHKTILLISHVGPIRVCVGDALQMPMAMCRQLRVDYASMTRIDYGTSKINMIYFNYLSDLPN